MTIIEQIKAEIERRKGYISVTHFAEELLPFLPALESEKPINPEEAMKELDEKIALVKQRGTWDGVDVDKYMDEVRGREPEKPMNQDELEKAIVDYFEGYWPGMETAEQCNTDLRFTPPAIMRLARHFAQWGAEHLASVGKTSGGSSEIPKDLEEAADNHIRKVADTAGHPGWDWTTQDIAEAFIAGAEWQAEQLLKSSPLPEDTVLFNKGVEEGKRLMMMDAVDTIVEDWNPDPEPEITIPLNPEEFTCGDKVRIIIVKED